MIEVITEIENINLPKSIAKKIKSKKIKLLETKDGILIKPVKDTILPAKGVLKNTKFNTEVYLKMKQKDKEKENG